MAATCTTANVQSDPHRSVFNLLFQESLRHTTRRTLGLQAPRLVDRSPCGGRCKHQARSHYIDEQFSPEVSIAILKHLWKAFIEESGLALSKHALYATVKVWIDFNDSKLPYLVTCVWLDLARLENATIQWGRVVVEDLEGLDQD